MRVSFILSVILTASSISCGTDNEAEPYVETTKKQKARKALDDKDYDAAAELYAEVIDEDPEDYVVYTLYATALAGKGGISLLSVVLDQLSSSGGGEESNGVLGLIDKIVPADITEAKTASVKSAVEVLRTIPDASLEEDSELKTSAQLQMTVYSAVYTAMLVDSLLAIENGQFTQENLDNLTVDQAAAIIDAFILAGSVGDPNNPLTQAMAGAGASISDLEGEDAKAQLQAYLEAQ